MGHTSGAKLASNCINYFQCCGKVRFGNGEGDVGNAVFRSILHNHVDVDVRRRERAEDCCGDTGPVVVPGKPEASELIARLISEDPKEVMPPPKSNKPRLGMPRYKNGWREVLLRK